LQSFFRNNKKKKEQSDMGNTPSSYDSSSDDEGQASTTRWESVRKRLPRSVDFAPVGLSAVERQDKDYTQKVGNFAAATFKAPLVMGGKVATKIGSQMSKMGKAVTHGVGNLTQHTTTIVQNTPRHLQNVFAIPLAINMATYKPPVYPKGPAEQAFLQGVLQEHFVFSDVSSGDMLALVMAFDKYEASKGTDLITQGEVATGDKDYFYVLWSGTVEYIINEKVIGTASQPGEAFGELALLYSCPRAATVHCKSDVTVYRLPQKTFRFILQLKRQQAEDTKMALMSQVPLLANLQRRELHKLHEHLRPVTFTAGQILSNVEQGEAKMVHERLVIVQQGEIEVKNVSLAGAKYADRVLKAGDYAGDMGFLMDSPNRLADAKALTDGLLWILDASAFLAVFGPNYKTVLRQRGHHAAVVKQLSMVPLLDENKALFDEFTLEALVELLKTQNYSTGETIVEERKRVEAALYFVTQGAVEITSEKPDADSGYAKIEKGGFFGEDLLKVDADVMDRRRRTRRHQPQQQARLDVTPTKAATYTVTCVADCTVQVLYLKEMRSVVDTTQIGKVSQQAVAEDDEHKIPLKDLKRHKILGAGTFGQVWLVSYSSHDAQNPGRQAYALKVQSKYELCQSGQARAVVRT
jgi:CRP-like cAMP-binding protein